MSLDFTFDIKLNRVDRVYHPSEKVSGVLTVRTESTLSHNGIHLEVEGAINLQLSARSVGLFEAFYSSLKPIQLMAYNIEISPPGKLNAGVTDFSFEFPLKPFQDKTLFETYHGVYVNIQYHINCSMGRSMLNKDVKKMLEFYVEIPAENTANKSTNPSFTISPASLQNVRKGSSHKIPDFLFEGKLDSTVCAISKPFTGEITVKRTAADIKSIELQLVRVETCSYLEGEAREATEIQNIQIGDGNVVPHMTIPIYMVFPRLFTCNTIISKAFRIEFEVNLIVLFGDNHMVTENFPIKLFRD